MITVLTLGTFDVPHYGHFVFLQMCRNISGQGGQVIVGLNSDKFVMKYRKVPCVLDYRERRLTLSKLPWVDFVVPNDQEDGGITKLLDEYKPNLIVISSDWSPWGPAKKDYLKQLGITQEDLDSRGVGLCFVPHTQGISSTEIKRRVTQS